LYPRQFFYFEFQFPVTQVTTGKFWTESNPVKNKNLLFPKLTPKFKFSRLPGVFLLTLWIRCWHVASGPNYNQTSPLPLVLTLRSYVRYDLIRGGERRERREQGRRRNGEEVRAGSGGKRRKEGRMGGRKAGVGSRKKG
jgi:hypothetical protein